MSNTNSFIKGLRNGVLFAAGAASYLYYQNFTLKMTNYYVESPKYHGSLNGFTIANLADLHIPHNNVKFETIITQTAAIKPDIIVLSGDIIGGDYDFDPEELRDFGQALVSIAPTYGVYGNHEIMSSVTNQMETVLTNTGVIFLHDEAVTYTYRGEPITIMGVREKYRMNATRGDLLRHIHLTDEQVLQPKILIAHHPETFLRYHEDINKSPDLVIVGHAHGGQIRIPGIGGLFSPDQGTLPKYTEGVFFIPGNLYKQMVVSRGIGASSFPVRINNRPEVVAIQLTDSIEKTVAGLEYATDYMIEDAGLLNPNSDD